MSDAAVKDKGAAKDGAPKDGSKAGAAAVAKPAKKEGGMMGPLAAAVLLLAVGGGVGFYLSGLVTSVKKAGATDGKALGEGAEKEGEKGAGKEEHKGEGLEHSAEVVMPDIMSNVRNQQGRRYVKVSCSFWVSHEDEAKLGLAAAGGEHGGGGPDSKCILQMGLEEHLKSYDLDELTGPNIYLLLRKGFQDQIEKSLHEVHPDLAPDKHVVQRVVLTNLLLQ